MLIFGMVLGWQVSLFTIVLASFLGLFASLITKKLKDNHPNYFDSNVNFNSVLQR